MATTSIYVEAGASARQQMVLPDDLLLEIFLRIGCPADLTRTSAACVAFRHLIADPTFLRRYRSHHAPLLLGFLNIYPSSKCFHPIEAPHPNAPAARALHNISFDFLPPARIDSWYIHDVCNGRVLLECSDAVNILPDFLVCDPWTRRYMMLPPVSHHGEDLDLVDAVFTPCADKNDETSFRVIGVMHYFTKLVISIFESGSDGWTTSKSSSWDALSLSYGTLLLRPCYAYGCLYWKIDESNSLLKLDIDSMELSIVVIPPNHELELVVVVEVGEGTFGMFTNHGRVLNYYHYNGSIADKWEMKSTVPFPDNDDIWFFEAQEGFVFVQTNRKVKESTSTCYLLDIKTLKLERFDIQMSSSDFCGTPYQFPTINSVSKIDMKC